MAENGNVKLMDLQYIMQTKKLNDISMAWIYSRPIHPKNFKLLNFWPISDRVALIQINTKPLKLNVIQVYASQSDHPDHVVELFYDEAQNALEQTYKDEIIIIMGDFDSKIGQGRETDILGDFGWGARNDRGDRLI